MSGNLAIDNARRAGRPRLAERVTMTNLDGTVVELETTHVISSKDVRTGGAIPFRVACPVTVDGVTLIAAGTLAMGVITAVEKCGRCGQPIKMAWNVKEAIAVDGTFIRLQLSVRLSGSEHSRTDDREMVAASLMFPGAPLALLFLSRQRENMVLIRSGERFLASVQGDMEVWPNPS